MFNIVYSNRTEGLAAALEAILEEPPPSVLAPEIVVVPTRAMGRWLTYRLADRHGICANARFLYPGNFIWEIFRLVLGERLPAVAPFSAEINAWRIYDALGDLPEGEACAPLRAYLRGADARQRHALAHRIAETFDQYAIFRPDWVRAWEQGGQTHWQASLWRRLIAGRRPLHWVHALDEFEAAATAGVEAALPARVTLFGLPALSPSYLEVIAHLSRRTRINLLLLNPSRHYWGDIVSPRTRAAAGEAGAAERYLHTGHPLLGSMGRPGRDFIDRVVEYEHVESECYAPPEAGTLLGALQSDIFELRDRGEEAGVRHEVPAMDRSIQVHACFSAMREVEVLHDRLLDMFERWPDLRPEQVLVAVTDLPRYAPYVSGVFGAVADHRRVPYDIVAEASPSGDPQLAAFFDLLGLPASRFAADAVLAPLEVASVQRRFGLDDDELARMRRWIAETGICWGWDEVHRAEFSVPPVASHTWRAGLERMLLGYALPEGDRLFGGILPYAEVEGSAARVLSALLDYLDLLQVWRKRLQAEMSVGDWTVELNALLADLFDPEPEDEAVLQSVRDALAAVARDAALAQSRSPIGIEVMAAELRRRLEAESARRFSLRGGVCVAEWSAARALPFEVICVLGLNDGVFPRPDRRVDFDRMASDWRRGDRSRRDEDRYLFLETVLAARRCLYLSYVGNDIRTGLPLPPSVLVSELLDLLERDFAPASPGTLRERILTHHPLQAFSPRYFNGDDRLFSYRRELAVAAPSADAARRPLFSTRLPDPGAEWSAVTVEDLVRFYHQPARFLLERRLRVRLAEYNDDLEACEPFALDRRAEREITERLTTTLLAGAGIEDAYPAELARGGLPPGQVGRIELRKAAARARALAARARARAGDMAVASPIPVDIALRGVRVTGTLRDVTATGLFQYGAADQIYASQRMEFWIRHLLLAAGAPARAGVSTLCTPEGMFEFDPVGDARAQLQNLLDRFLEGLREPLHFFPRSAFAYVEARLKGRDAMGAARAAWEGNDFKRGEGDDVYYRLAFAGAAPLDAAFERLARDLVEPLIAHVRGEP